MLLFCVRKMLFFVEIFMTTSFCLMQFLQFSEFVVGMWEIHHKTGGPKELEGCRCQQPGPPVPCHCRWIWCDVMTYQIFLTFATYIFFFLIDSCLSMHSLQHICPPRSKNHFRKHLRNELSVFPPDYPQCEQDKQQQAAPSASASQSEGD